MPITINAQFDGKCFIPFTEKDKDEAAAYQKNKIVTLRITGAQKVPSIREMGTFWSACSLLAENTEDKHFDNKDKVCSQVKIALNFVDMDRMIVTPGGDIRVEYLSISFDNLKQIERTRFFDRAFDQMAEWMGISREQLIEEAKARCNRY